MNTVAILKDNSAVHINRSSNGTLRLYFTGADYSMNHYGVITLNDLEQLYIVAKTLV